MTDLQLLVSFLFSRSEFVLLPWLATVFGLVLGMS